MSDEAEFDRLKSVEDRLLALETQGRWFVYELCYNDATEVPFYIGLSTDVERRVSQHKSNKGSAAYEGCQEGFVCRVIREFNNYPEALLFETMQISLRPSLSNRDVSECRNKLKLPAEFWAMFDGFENIRNEVMRTLIPAVPDFVRKEALAEALAKAVNAEVA